MGKPFWWDGWKKSQNKPGYRPRHRSHHGTSQHATTTHAAVTADKIKEKEEEQHGKRWQHAPPPKQDPPKQTGFGLGSTAQAGI